MEHTYDSILGLIQARGRPVVSRRVANNTYAERLEFDGEQYILEDEHNFSEKPNAVGIRLHSHHIVTFTRGGALILDHHGINTSTTLERLNQFSPLAVLRGVPWLVGRRGHWTKPFENRLVFRRDAEGNWYPEHEHRPADWSPLGAVHCEECGLEIITDLPAEGESERWEAV